MEHKGTEQVQIVAPVEAVYETRHTFAFTTAEVAVLRAALGPTKGEPIGRTEAGRGRVYAMYRAFGDITRGTDYDDAMLDYQNNFVGFPEQEEN